MRSYRITVLALILVFLALPCGIASAQNKNKIQEIRVEGARQASPALVITQSGLQVGSMLSSDNASEAIKKLWTLGIFSDVRLLRETVDNGLSVIIVVSELPVVNSIALHGFKEFKEQEIINTINLTKNKAIGDQSVAKMSRQIKEMYSQKGFLLANVNFHITPVSGDSAKVDVAIDVTEGKKVKIKHITFVGNKNVASGKLKKVMTSKEDRWYSSGDFKKENLEKDKLSIVAFYKSQGYRDASVLSDSLAVDARTENVSLVPASCRRE